MSLTPPGVISDALEKLRSPEGQKMMRYSMASVVSVIVSLVALVFFNGVVGLAAVPSSTLATAIAAVPSYWLNRKWAWGKHGRSHLLKEVLPFWTLAFIGWAFSAYSVHQVELWAKHNQLSHLSRTAVVAVAYVGAFGILWVGKFIIFNRVLFVHRSRDLTTLDSSPGVGG
jgi:putative flippase GtrA